jgi:hypothetical protein
MSKISLYSTWISSVGLSDIETTYLEVHEDTPPDRNKVEYVELALPVAPTRLLVLTTLLY